MNFISGFILGVVVSTIGFSGVARILDKATDVVKHESTELAK